VCAREEQVIALETALNAQHNRIAEEATAGQQLRLEAEKERCRACALDSALASAQLDSMLLRAQLEGETTRHKATLATLEILRSDMRDMRREHAPVPCASVALSTSSLCCQKELDLEQQVSASLRNAHLLLTQVPPSLPAYLIILKIVLHLLITTFWYLLIMHNFYTFYQKRKFQSH
jgi:hypothetical protein